MKRARLTIVVPAFALAALWISCPGAAATLNVTDFGARGDAIQTLASTVSYSTLVTLDLTNQLSRRMPAN